MMLIRYILASLGQCGTPRRQHGATLIEYVLIVAVIAIAVFGAASFGLGTAISDIFTEAKSTISGA